MKSRKKRFFVWLFLCLFTVQLCAVGAAAADRSTLRIRYHYENEPIPGAEFHLFYMGEADGKGGFELNSTFAAYPVKTEYSSADEWTELAVTLKAYVEKDGLKADFSAVTDENGRIVFPDLSDGLYLVIGDKCSTEDYTCFALPCVVALPAWEESGGSYVRDTTVSPKLSREKNPENPPEPVSRKVIKVWEDNGNTSQRPKSITVDLLRDGTVYDTVTLSYDTDWRYFWEELPACDEEGNRIEWSVAEHIENGSIYSVKIERTGATFTVTNSCVLPTPTPPPVLPKTGQDWWPVPLLLGAGLIFLLIGIVRRKSVKE